MISITIQQVCLVINRKYGADVVFPETGHALILASNERPVTGEIELVVYDQLGNPVPKSATGSPDRNWVPDLGEVVDMLVRGKSLDQLRHVSGVQAVLSLTGGYFETGQASPPNRGPDYSLKQWRHRNWSGRMTNWVRWEHEPGDRTLVLAQAGATFLELHDGDSVVLTNRDIVDPSDSSGNDVFAEDFGLLYRFVNTAATITEPVRPSTRRLRDDGILRADNPRLPLCPVGQTS